MRHLACAGYSRKGTLAPGRHKAAHRRGRGLLRWPSGKRQLGSYLSLYTKVNGNGSNVSAWVEKNHKRISKRQKRLYSLGGHVFLNVTIRDGRGDEKAVYEGGK